MSEEKKYICAVCHEPLTISRGMAVSQTPNGPRVTCDPKYGDRMHKAESVSGEPPLCADCNHERNDPRFHFEAPGDNWGAALHHFRAKSGELPRTEPPTVTMSSQELLAGSRPSAPEPPNIPDEFDETPESAYGLEPSLEYRKGWNAALRELTGPRPSAPAPSGEPGVCPKCGNIVSFGKTWLHAVSRCVEDPPCQHLRTTTRGADCNHLIAESSPVDLQQTAEKWWAENWNRFGESRSRVDVPKALAAFAAHLRGK